MNITESDEQHRKINAFICSMNAFARDFFIQCLDTRKTCVCTLPELSPGFMWVVYNRAQEEVVCYRFVCFLFPVRRRQAAAPSCTGNSEIFYAVHIHIMPRAPHMYVRSLWWTRGANSSSLCACSPCLYFIMYPAGMRGRRVLYWMSGRGRKAQAASSSGG